MAESAAELAELRSNTSVSQSLEHSPLLVITQQPVDATQIDVSKTVEEGPRRSFESNIPASQPLEGSLLSVITQQPVDAKKSNVPVKEKLERSSKTIIAKCPKCLNKVDAKFELDGSLKSNLPTLVRSSLCCFYGCCCCVWFYCCCRLCCNGHIEKDAVFSCPSCEFQGKNFIKDYACGEKGMRQASTVSFLQQ